MKIAIYGRQFNDAAVFPYIQLVFDNLLQHEVDIYMFIISLTNIWMER